MAKPLEETSASRSYAVSPVTSMVGNERSARRAISVAAALPVNRGPKDVQDSGLAGSSDSCCDLRRHKPAHSCVGWPL